VSIRSALISAVLRRTLKKQFDNIGDVTEFRHKMASAGGLASKTPDNVFVSAVKVPTDSASEIHCEWLQMKQVSSEPVLIYLHGGGYIFGGLDSHRDIAWRLAEAGAVRVLNVGYRLAPEHPFPAALEDAIACYKWLLASGVSPNQVAIGGDSAGGGLAVATLVNIKNLGLPMPNCAILLSPWTDLSLSGDSVQANANSDVMLTPSALKEMADQYLGERDRKAPLASPLFADLSDLPAIFIQASESEILLSDAQRLETKILAAGGEAKLETWPKMPHVWQVLAARIPEGKTAIVKLGEFLKIRLSGQL
jgi:monoterpene epsilon-lactone hydrolase